MIASQTWAVKTQVNTNVCASWGEWLQVVGARDALSQWLMVAVLSLAVYVALFGTMDVLGFGFAWADDDPFTYAANKGKELGTGFMLFVRVIMVFAIVGICGYAWFKGGKVSPAWIIACVVAGLIAVRADLVVKMFGSTNPFSNVN